MKSLGRSVSKIAAPILGRRGLGEAQILSEWAAVVGAEIAADSLPIKLAFGKGDRMNGTLYLKVTPGAGLKIQHLEPQIIERINGFFGYRAVGRLALRQGPIPRLRDKTPPPVIPLSAQQMGRVADTVAQVQDPTLRAALERLGQAVARAEQVKSDEKAASTTKTLPQRLARPLGSR